MNIIYMIIRDSGDGGQTIDIVKNEEVLDRMAELADTGCSGYSSGDGLQCRKITFPDGFDVDAWVKAHFYDYITLEDLK
jgi:hypothetical protein